MAGPDRAKTLESAIFQIQKQFGKGSIMRLGEHNQEKIPVISTGSLGIDIATGVGGFPRGRIIEIYGPTAKTNKMDTGTHKAGGRSRDSLNFQIATGRILF